MLRTMKTTTDLTALANRLLADARMRSRVDHSTYALTPAPSLMQRARGAALVPRLLRAMEHTMALRLGAAVVPSLGGRADRACGPIR